MDNVTHALAGLLIAEGALALAERRPAPPTSAAPGFRRAALLLGVVAAELPDADLVYSGAVLGMGKLGYLLHHRGHTHTLVFVVLGALLAWGATLLARREARAPAERWWLLGVAMVGTLSHLVLDWTNSYGVHPFWPVSNAWHYGDAVFIVEPWLWVTAIVPMLFLERARLTRLLMGGALVAILGLAWGVSMVGRDVALALTLAAAAWLAVVALVGRPAARVALAAGAWLVVEGVFFASSSAARGVVRAAVGDATLEEAALSPAVGNPLCFDALVVERDGGTYRVTQATVAPWPALRAVAGCGGASRGPIGAGQPSSRPATPAIRWAREWSAPVAELASLAATNCEVAASLRFVRVPAWQRLPGDSVRLADLRFNRGGGGFAEIVAPARPDVCPRYVPAWEPPRARLLEATTRAAAR